MKKLIILLLVICLFGCEKSVDKKLADLGYSQEDIDMIITYPENIQNNFLNEYNIKYLALMHTDGFNINLLDEYLKYDGLLDINEIVYIVNNNIDYNLYLKTKRIEKDEYYLEKNKDLYLEYIDSYDTVRDCVEAVNTKTYLPYYTNIIDTDLSKDYLMLVNKYNALSSDFEPDDLVDIDSHYGRGRTRAAVYEAYKQLADDAFDLGYDIWICSAYRDYNLQYGLYQGYLEDEGGNQAIVDTYSARPGHSEHQSGLCLDLYDSYYGMDNFGYSEASKWINENCYKYGFIIRYTAEKEKVTGYQAEPWQIRYVGSSETAKDIMDRGITFDEYYACFVE